LNVSSLRLLQLEIFDSSSKFSIRSLIGKEGKRGATTASAEHQRGISSRGSTSAR
jgi:hypothetical protein